MEEKVRKTAQAIVRQTKCHRDPGPGPQEFWDERPILYKQSGQASTELFHHSIMIH